MHNYFSDDELRCKCGCKQMLFDPAVREKLNALRHDYGKPMIVSSGYRCELHPVEVRKKTPGEHTQGCAVDIRVALSDAYDLLEVAFRHGVPRIGVQQKNAPETRFIHLGWSCLTAKTVWSY